MKYFSSFIIILSIATGIYILQEQEEAPINITVSSWSGYTPIFYAKEKGWLEKYNLNILHVSTLYENLKLYKTGLADGLATTNDVALKLQEKHPLVPVMVLDRSHGGDRVLSNVSLDKIKSMKDEIEVYLEIGSVNQLVFEGFIEYYDLNRSQFKLYNAHQNILSQKKISDKPTILITYDPFSDILIQKGYQEIASSKLSTITIIDLLVVKESIYQKYPNVFSQLRKSINQAIKNLEDDPSEFYKTIEHYLEGQTYDEFLSSLDGIKFIKTAADEKLYLDIYQRQSQKKN